jgi:hypothetical protein
MKMKGPTPEITFTLLPIALTVKRIVKSVIMNPRILFCGWERL